MGEGRDCRLLPQFSIATPTVSAQTFRYTGRCAAGRPEATSRGALAAKFFDAGFRPEIRGPSRRGSKMHLTVLGQAYGVDLDNRFARILVGGKRRDGWPEAVQALL